MMSKSRVLVFVVTFISFIDYSYLSKIVVLPSIEDRNFGEYLMNIDWKGQGRILREEEFFRVKYNYENVMKAQYENPNNVKLIKEINNLAIHNEKRILRMLMNYDDCGEAIKARINEYIETHETIHDDDGLLTLEEQKAEETYFLQTLIPLTDFKGRMRNLYLSTVYGSNQHKIHSVKNSIDSVWLHLLRTLDPMFGEKYYSYAFRVISKKKMPLPQNDIPEFYGNGKLYLFDEFDIWPELNAVFIMYYLFYCPLEKSIMFDSSHEVTEKSEPSSILPSRL